MTVRELFDQCLTRLNTDTQEFGYGELLDYFGDILDGLYHELALRGCRRILKSLEITASPTALPDDFLLFYKIVYGDDALEVEKIEPELASALSENDYHYYILGDDLYIVPSVPDGCTAYYFYRTTVTLDDDVPFEGILAPLYKQMLTKMALMRLEARTPDIDSLAAYFSTLATKVMLYSEGRPVKMRVDSNAF